MRGRDRIISQFLKLFFPFKFELPCILGPFIVFIIQGIPEGIDYWRIRSLSIPAFSPILGLWTNDIELLESILALALLLSPISLIYVSGGSEGITRRRLVFIALGVGVLLGLSIRYISPHLKPISPIEAKGEKVFVRVKCYSCHGINGKGISEAGPDLGAISGKRTESDIVKILRDPSSIDPRSPMPSYTLPEGDMEALAAYVARIGPDSRMPPLPPTVSRRPSSHMEKDWAVRHKFEVKKDPKRCSSCHERSFCQGCHGDRRPDSHLGQWMKFHPGIASEGAEACYICHGETQCSSCHKGLWHGTGWIRDHARRSLRDQTICFQCHPRSFCTACHMGVRPSDHGPTWIGIHGKRDIKRCERCHKKSYCSDCHSRQKPESHVGNWAFTHGRVASFGTGSRCFICHKRSYCDRCHEE